MGYQTERKVRGGAILFAVLLAHALLGAFLLTRQYSGRHPAALPDEITLFYLPPPKAPRLPLAAPEQPASLHRTPPQHETATASVPSSIAAPASEPSPWLALPPIDWTDEQATVAESKGREIWKQLAQHCREAEAARLHPPECHHYVAPEPWEPEDPRFGLAGPLPYVRLGPCVLGLGFWGCGFGKPQANGHVFDGMLDPDRPRSSVPDNGSYAPPPEPRERLH
jgi:hypothetical protein